MPVMVIKASIFYEGRACKFLAFGRVFDNRARDCSSPHFSNQAANPRLASKDSQRTPGTTVEGNRRFRPPVWLRLELNKIRPWALRTGSACLQLGANIGGIDSGTTKTQQVNRLGLAKIQSDEGLIILADPIVLIAFRAGGVGDADGVRLIGDFGRFTAEGGCCNRFRDCFKTSSRPPAIV